MLSARPTTHGKGSGTARPFYRAPTPRGCPFRRRAPASRCRSPPARMRSRSPPRTWWPRGRSWAPSSAGLTRVRWPHRRANVLTGIYRRKLSRKKEKSRFIEGNLREHQRFSPIANRPIFSFAKNPLPGYLEKTLRKCAWGMKCTTAESGPRGPGNA